MTCFQRSILPVTRKAVLLLVAWAGLPGVAAGQYRLVSPSGDTLSLQVDSLRRMLDSARALYADLEQDPRVGYFLDFGEPAETDQPQAALPWNAVEVQSDSSATVLTPGNLREADRAYHNYAVLRMRAVRGGDPDVSCDSLLAVEERVVSSFVEGWILARTLFGGPAFAPLDALAFARSEGLLRPLIAAERDRHVGACASEWAESHPAAIERYAEWRAAFFGPTGEGREPAAGPDSLDVVSSPGTEGPPEMRGPQGTDSATGRLPDPSVADDGRREAGAAEGSSGRQRGD